MDRTVDKDVQLDTHAEREMDTVAHDLTVNHRRTVGAGSQAQGPLPPESAGDQVVVGDIPAEPPGFLPRAGLLAELDRAGTRVSVINSVTGLRGLGGTQLAAAYARTRLTAGWKLVAWVNGADAGSLLVGLAAVADATGLNYPGTGRRLADTGAAVRHWLETDGHHCLVVFDDVSDPEMLRSFVPSHGTARVLIISSRQSAANLGRAVPVDVFSADEASAFLAARTGLDDEAGAAAVAAALGHLPLMLALAAPVIRGQRHGYARYLDRLQTIPAEVSLTGDDGQPYPRSVAQAVLLSLEAVGAADQTGMCTRVLQIMAALSAAGVRRELLHVAGRAGVLASGGRRVEAAVVDQVLDWLIDRSLLTLSLDGQTVVMHRLVAQVIRDGLARRRRLEAASWVAASVLEAHAIAIAGTQDRLAVRRIPQQVTALLDNTAEQVGEADEALVGILLRLRFIALYHLIELGDSTPQAIAVGEPLIADLERLLGPSDPDTLNARNSLAAAYLAAGRVGDAIALLEQTLVVLQHQLGPDHPDTLTSQNNLASAYQDAGRVAEAIQLYELNLAVRERLLGADHLGTLNSRGNLAAAYLAAGRVADAIPLFEQTLASRERVLGADHPDTHTSRKNLAKAYQDVGRTTEALPLLERTLAGRDLVLRPIHAAMESQAPADAVVKGLSASFRRPPADPAGPVLPGGFRRPPADPARRLRSDRVARPSAKLSDHSSPRPMQDVRLKDAEHDREVVAAITAGDPAGIAMAYDRHAAALYSYCHWMLHDSAAAAESLQDTFVLAISTLSELPEPSVLRPWLFALARNECRRRIRPGSVTSDEADRAASPTDAANRPTDAATPLRVVSEPAGPTDGLAHGNGRLGQAELRTLIRSALADMKPREREVIELSFRHDLYDNDLAIALGVSQSRVQALASRTGGRLEKSFGTLRAALAGRQACPVVGELLADWDGQLTEQTRDLVVWHIEQCPTCVNHTRASLRPTVFSSLLPSASLPPELREKVLSRCSSTSEEAVAYRRRVIRRAGSTWVPIFSQAIRWVSWDSIRAYPGAAIAAAAVAVWIVAAVSVALLTFAGSHAGHAQATQASAGTSMSPAAAASAPRSGAVRPPLTVTQPSAYVSSRAQPRPSSPASKSPSRSRSPSSSPSLTA